MPRLRLALAQADPTVGDLTGNAERALTAARAAAGQDADIIVFPEMFLTGYPIEDLALRPSFQDASRAMLESFAAELARDGLGERIVIMGYLDRIDIGSGLGQPHRGPINAAAVIQHGQV
ncbi:MAG: nitrilase-related carbon-nitrogen hydrolase, partial [Candidatus Nanopelagicales bacterium]